ncbi:MAG: TonB-dependent receptor [Afipia sp. 64-13]|nr:MAG: TonB-dependent receptor [Afipia sp. 64-13]
MSKSALLSASYIVLGLAMCITEADAQQAQTQSGVSTLPPVVISPSKPRTQRRPRTASSTSRTRRAARAPAHNQPKTVEQTWAADSQAARTGTTGYVASSTSVATKTNTPLINIPQSVNVLTKDFIQDQSFGHMTDATRYVPGVAIHQGEGNRDELVIRGVDSSANFFVNGFRDDVQYFRDLYNTQSIEVLKGPSALIFGRGAGGGLVNRTLKEADGTRVYEATAQTGSFGDRRVTLDAGQAINEAVAVRLNAFYEGSDTFRDYGRLERYGFNPTLTWKVNDDTKVKLSYEYYHDRELADRGNPSIASTLPGGATRFNPTVPFAPNGNFATFFGNPLVNNTYADVQTGMAVIEHDFGNGLTVKNSSLYADYNRGYVNVYPGSAANLVSAPPSMNLSGYMNTTNRENAFNQTDFTYKAATGSILHTLTFGTEFGRQTGTGLRNSATFGGAANAVVNPFNPTYFGPVEFVHKTTDADNKYRLNIESAYVQDQIEITRWLQLIAGARFDRFDLDVLDHNTGIQRGRVDEKVSPRVGVVVKPVDNVSVYGAYSISYLPSSGDQFSALNDGTVILEPQKFENTEFGVKWNINPKLLFTSAVYELNRTNQPITDPVRGSPFVLPNGATRMRGFEASLNGYVTDRWQSILGYAYTDARITKDLTAGSVVAGNRVQLVPYNQFSWWNKYQIDSRWAAAVGVIHFTDSYAASDDTVRLPGFTRVDAAVYLKINETWSGQFNVENIFDKGYWASADGNNNLSPGATRTFRVLARAKF